MKNSEPVSLRQKKYLLSIRRNSILIQVSRVLLFVFLVGLWEISARTGLIDSFIFSSPGQILEKMWEMLLDHTLIDHVSITLLETLISFALVTILGIGCGVLLCLSPALSHSGALSGSAEQPSKICSGPSSHCVAGQQYENHYPGRNLCGCLRSHYESLYGILRDRPG